MNVTLAPSPPHLGMFQLSCDDDSCVLPVGRFVCSQEAGRHDNHPIQGSDKPGVCDCLCTVYVTVPLHDNVSPFLSSPSSPPHPPHPPPLIPSSPPSPHSPPSSLSMLVWSNYLRTLIFYLTAPASPTPRNLHCTK